MVAIRAALNLQHGGMKDFYICSLSSRFVLETQKSEYIALCCSAMTNFLKFICLIQDCCLQRSVEA